jgi:DNA-binding NtrC family response regulator
MVSGAALALLKAYDWPGNIRQLENAVFRAMVLCDGQTLAVEDFPQIRAQVEDIATLAEPTLPTSDHAAAGPANYGTIKAPLLQSQPTSPAQGRFGILNALDSRGNVRALADVELEMIRLAIDHYHGQMSEVARRLGIGRSTLYRKLKEHGIDPETGRTEKGGVPAG